MNGSILANRSTTSRRALDLYPTPPDATRALMNFLHHREGWHDMIVWEPAAGDGAISRVLREYGHTVFETDISTGEDFLTYELDVNMRPDAIITNPPFNLSAQFIDRALSYTRNVAMLLKSQYWHAAKRRDLFVNSEPSYVLPLTWRPDFDGRGAPTMEVLWTVWSQGPVGDCAYIPLDRPTSTMKL